MEDALIGIAVGIAVLVSAFWLACYVLLPNVLAVPL